MSSKFGWSYPAGCSGPPDPDDHISKLQEDVLGLLEDAGAPTELNDQIMKLIADWEAKQSGPEYDGPPSEPY